MPPETLVPALVEQRLPWLNSEGDIWLVGGAIRDQFLRRPTFDLDFAVARNARLLGRKVADGLGAPYFDLDRERDTGRVLFQDEGGSRWSLDFAGLRGATIMEDLEKRDFTINAMGVSLSAPGELLDPTGGLRDLRQKLLRPCSVNAIESDPLRALRAVRLAVDLELSLAPSSIEQITSGKANLASVSEERIRDEYFLMLASAEAAKCLRLLDHLSLLVQFIPEVEAAKHRTVPGSRWKNDWEWTLGMLAWMDQLLQVLGRNRGPRAEANLWAASLTLGLGRLRGPLADYLDTELSLGRTVRQILYFSGVFLGPGGFGWGESVDASASEAHKSAPDTALATVGRARALRLSNQEVKRIGQVVDHHSLPNDLLGQLPLSSRSIYRYFKTVGPAGIEVALLHLAGFLATHFPPLPSEEWGRRVELANALLSAYFESQDRIVSPPSLVRGDELERELGLEAGPEIGRVLDIIEEAQAAGEVSDRAGALDFARRTLRAEEEGKQPREGAG